MQRVSQLLVRIGGDLDSTEVIEVEEHAEDGVGLVKLAPHQLNADREALPMAA